VQDALQKAIHTLQEDFPVCAGAIWWMVSRQSHCKHVAREGTGYVQAVMIDGGAAQRNESLALRSGG